VNSRNGRVPKGSQKYRMFHNLSDVKVVSDLAGALCNFVFQQRSRSIGGDRDADWFNSILTRVVTK
jgi:hypothetical protein